MSPSYGRVNYITSFGFSRRWRKQCVKALNISKGTVVVDLLCGMGECWSSILDCADEHSELIALDFSTEMIRRASHVARKYPKKKIKILEENVFNNSIQSSSADYVVSGFGLKTFNEVQLHRLAEEIKRILKPNGSFSFIDVSVPHNKILRVSYIFFLKRLIPFLGKLLLGSPEAYKMVPDIIPGVATHLVSRKKISG